MHLSPKISGVELPFLSAWWRGYNLNYALWHTGVIQCQFRLTILSIFAPEAYANLQRWRTLEELLAYLRREVYMECTLDTCKPNGKKIMSNCATICQSKNPPQKQGSCEAYYILISRMSIYSNDFH